MGWARRSFIIGMQAVAARQELGVVLVLAEEAQRLLDASPGAWYSNGAGYMASPPSSYWRFGALDGLPDALGVSGMSMWSMPSGDSASTTALTTAGGRGDGAGLPRALDAHAG